MFEKQIESIFKDPHGGNDEHEKHRVAAEQTLGANPVLISSTTGGVLNDEGTDTVLWKMTTRWRQRHADQA